MDLIVNGPVKSGIRRARCAELYNYFQNWKLKRLEATVRALRVRCECALMRILCGVRALCESRFECTGEQDAAAQVQPAKAKGR